MFDPRDVTSLTDNANRHVHLRAFVRDYHKIPNHRNSANMANESNRDFKSPDAFKVARFDGD